MYKKIMIFFFLIIVIISSTVFADDDIEEEELENFEEFIEASNLATDIPNINSRSAVVLDRNTGIVLYGKNENTKRPMASTTKIMTAIIVIENADLSKTVEISKKAAGTGGSRLRSIKWS